MSIINAIVHQNRRFRLDYCFIKSPRCESNALSSQPVEARSLEVVHAQNNMELTRYHSDVKFAQVSGKMMEYEGFSRGKLVQSLSVSITKQKYQEVTSSFSKSAVAPAAIGARRFDISLAPEEIIEMPREF